MASQWVINNKKVKDWTIGGKKVKSLTLANGKILNFIASTPSIQTIKSTEYVNDIVASAGYSIRVQNIQNDYFKRITTAGSTEAVSFAIEIRCSAPLVYNGISTFRITDIVNRNHLDVRVATGTFTLQNGHKYHIEPGKDPEDLGTY